MPLFCLFLSFKTKHYKFYNKNMLCASFIQCRDSNPRPLEHDFPSITTRPGLPPLWSIYLPKIVGPEIHVTCRFANYIFRDIRDKISTSGFNVKWDSIESHLQIQIASFVLFTYLRGIQNYIKRAVSRMQFVHFANR